MAKKNRRLTPGAASDLLWLCSTLLQNGQREAAFKVWPGIEAAVCQIEDPQAFLAATIRVSQFYENRLLGGGV